MPVVIKKPAKKVARKTVKSVRGLRAPRPLAAGKPTAGFLAGTMVVGPDFDPAAPAFTAAEWEK